MPIDPHENLKTKQFISFEQARSEDNLLEDWKGEANKFLRWVCWLIGQDRRIDRRVKDSLVLFFRSSLALDPQLRFNNLEHLLDGLYRLPRAFVLA